VAFVVGGRLDAVVHSADVALREDFQDLLLELS
jgi:hypothetical protein